MALSPWKAKSKDIGEVWVGVGREWSSLEFGPLGKQGVWVALGWLCLAVPKTLAGREVKKPLKGKLQFQLLVHFASMWPCFSEFLANLFLVSKNGL